jgi:hypothetical protein
VRRVPVEGVAIGVYGASGGPRGGRRRRARRRQSRKKKEGFLYRELSYGRGRPDLPLETGLRLGNSPRSGSLHDIAGGDPPDASPYCDPSRPLWGASTPACGPRRALNYLPRSSIRPRDDLEEENVALEASQMTPSPTLPLPKSPLNDLEGGPYARMRSQIRPLDDLL